MLKRTEVLATMAATIAAGLLQRVYTDRDGHQQPSIQIDAAAGEARSMAVDILDLLEASEWRELEQKPPPTSIPGPGTDGRR